MTNLGVKGTFIYFLQYFFGTTSVTCCGVGGEAIICMNDRLSTSTAANEEHNNYLLKLARRDKQNQQRTQDVKLQHFRFPSSD
jgi:hypothetical protein